MTDRAVEAMNALSDEDLLDCLARVLEPRNVVLQGLVDWAAPEHAYVPAKAITDHRFEGMVKSYNAHSGYGFIDSPSIKEAFGNDVFVHGGQLGSLAPGTKVNFAVLLSKEHKPQAFDVTEGSASQYAKSGGRHGAEAAAASGKGPTGKAPPTKGGKPGKGSLDAGGCWSHPAAGKGPPPSQEGFGGGGCWMSPAAAWSHLQGEGWMGPWDSPAPGAFWGGGEAAWGAESSKAGRMNGKGPSKGHAKDGLAPKGHAKDGPSKAGGKRNGKGSTEAPPTSKEVPGLTDTRFEGSIKKFNSATGFGFIECPEIAEFMGEECDVFLHHAQIGDFAVGDQVMFSVILNKEGKPQGKDLSSAQRGAKRGRWS